jgi:predicted membrane-bound mannosyltransferase
MFKAIRRLFGLFALLAVIFGALQSLFKWLDRNELDSNEVFEDEEHML